MNNHSLTHSLRYAHKPYPTAYFITLSSHYEFIQILLPVHHPSKILLPNPDFRTLTCN